MQKKKKKLAQILRRMVNAVNMLGNLESGRQNKHSKPPICHRKLRNCHQVACSEMTKYTNNPNQTIIDDEENWWVPVEVMSATLPQNTTF